MATNSPLGPNVKKLIIRKMGVDAVPKGGGMVDAIKFLSSKGAVAAGWRTAAEWVQSQIQFVRNAAEPNPWKTADDETIAGYLVKKVEERLNA